MPDFTFGWIRIVFEEVGCSHNDAWGTEAALQAMLLFKARLQRMQGAIGGHAFDCGHFATICLNGKHGTRFYRSAVDVNSAGTALACVAANMGTGQREVLSQKIYKQGTRFDLRGMLNAIHGDFDGLRHTSGNFAKKLKG